MLSRKLPFLLELVLLCSSELKFGAMMGQRSGREMSTGLACETYQHHQKTERKVVAEASITKEGWITHVPARKPCRRFLEVSLF